MYIWLWLCKPGLLRMKKFIILFFVIGFALSTRAQKTATGDGLMDGYFTLSAGLGMPVGDFGSNNVTNPNAYWAKPGANFELSYTARFSEYLGVVVMARSISIAHSVMGTGGFFNGNDTNYYWTTDATPNKVKMAMAGMYGSVPLTKSKNVTLFFKPMIGASFIAESTIDYNVYARETKQLVANIKITPNGQSYNFAYAFALGLKYNVTPTIAMVLQMDYVSTNPQFNAQMAAATPAGVFYADVTPYNIRMQLMNFNMGLAVRIK